MPQNRNSKPPEVMTWGKAAPVIIVAFVFDALRFVFEMFWFFGPALAAWYCTSQVSDIAVIGGLLTAGCVAGAGALGFFGAGPIAAFGVIMAMAVGFMGWITLGLITLMTNPRILSENKGNALWFVGSLMVSELPFIGSLPALTGTMVKMYHSQIKKEKAMLKEYQKAHAAELAQERQRQIEQFTAIQNAQMVQSQEQEAANDAQYVEQKEATNDEQYTPEMQKAA